MTSGRLASEYPASELMARYARPTQFDELVDDAGNIRPHWKPLIGELERLDKATLDARIEILNARVRETGIAHDVFSDPSSTVQPWRVDFVPLLITEQEWRAIERAMAQRARLFEAILADLYGDQTLLKSAAIPHELVFSDRSYLRPCRNLKPPHGYLQFLAADLARDANGAWRVIDTHAETPAGIGYALANRMVHTNVAGDIFLASKALRLAPFFQALQASLAQRANRPDPTIVLLTPGPRHNDFFSHAYLARYLGFQLAEGGDLRVSDDRVALKTLNGLQPIDLVVRCIAGAFADPLELDSTGFAGPVGLLQALRKSPGLVINALGSALAENRGLGAYLPYLSRQLLNEELLMADGRRWWLGSDDNRRHVLAHLSDMVIRPAQEGTARPGRAVPGIDPARLSSSDRERLVREIEARGPLLVAEEKVGFGTTPSLTPSGFAPTPYALRVFVASTADGFVLMPGGLAMTVNPDLTVALSAPDGEARDVWIVSDHAPAPYTSLWQAISADQVQRAPQLLPSRAADNLYWLGRYVEGADWTMRVLRVCLGRLQEDSAPRRGLTASRTALETLLSDEDDEVPEAWRPTSPALILDLARALMTSAEWQCGLPCLLENIHRVASVTRDRLSSEAWRTLRDFEASGRWRPDAMPHATTDILRMMDDGLRVLAAFHGLSHENMTRSFGWSFLDMGRRLSRAFNLAELLLAIFGEAPQGEDEMGSLQLALELADSFITYRSRYRLAPVLPLVLELLLADETNPRSIAFQLKELARHIETLPQSGEGGQRIEEQRQILELLSSVQLADMGMLARANSECARPKLQKLLGRIVEVLPQLSDSIGKRYFNLLEHGVRWGRVNARVEP